MARSFVNVKIFSSLTRRGYAVASQSATKGGVTSMRGNMGNKSGEEKSVISPYKVSWVPDPVTGYYKPENINEIDAAELRATLLGKKFNN